MTSFTKAELVELGINVLSAALPIKTCPINTLRQVRGSLNQADTDVLAEEILAIGQLTRARVVALEEEAAREYVTQINQLWGTQERFRRLKACEIDGVTYYLFVVYGHRRLAACKQATKLLDSGKRRSKHFDGRFRCDVVFGLSMLEAVFMQFGENSYVKPSLHDEMTALWRLWRFMHTNNPKLSVTAFAARSGRSPRKVHDMLHFTALPEQIQAWVDPSHRGGSVPYTMLLEVSRLVQAHKRAKQTLSVKEIEMLVVQLIARRVKVKDFRAEVTARIEALEGQQGDLLLDGAVEKPQVRRVAEAEVVKVMYANTAYLKAVQALADAGAFAGENPILSQSEGTVLYSPHSPAKLALRLTETLSLVGANLASLIRKEGRSSRKLEVGLGNLAHVHALLTEYVE
jgi:hypothetical protein